jgi:hypothetical protein
MTNTNQHFQLDKAFYTTSVTLDEAVANLLSGLRGPAVFTSNSEGLSDEDYEFLSGLRFDLFERLDEDKQSLESDLFEAKYEKKPDHIIAEIEAAIVAHANKIDQAKRYLCALEDELNKGDSSALRLDQMRSSPDFPYITMASLDEWARGRYSISIIESGRLIESRSEPQGVSPDNSKPWDIRDDSDPSAEQPWYTPARYFARQLVKEDPTLLVKKDTLSKKVSASLTGVGIFKRGGVKALNPATIKKAFVNLRF